LSLIELSFEELNESLSAFLRKTVLHSEQRNASEPKNTIPHKNKSNSLPEEYILLIYIGQNIKNRL
jgi:hypothetical protein